MNSIDEPIRSSSEEEFAESRWIELGSSIACWVGIIGLILLIAHGSWALDSGQGRSSFPSGPRSFNPPSAAQVNPGGHGNNNLWNNSGLSNFDDDDEEDDFETFEDGAGNLPPQFAQHMGKNQQPSHSHGGISPAESPSSHSPRTLSAGGVPNTGPDPIVTDKGIIVGGSPSNGVVSKSKPSSIKVDNETAEGSKDIVVDFNFPDAEILDIAKTLGKLTGKNFIYDKDVKGKITIVSNSPITVGEAWKVFLTALDINGFALIPSGKYLRISRQRDARDKQLKTYTGDYSPDTDALITRVFQLKYISAEEVARTFRSFIPANSRVIPYEQTNTVIVTDTGANIAKLAKMLEILDVEGYDAGIEVIPVKYASAADLSKLIDTLIPGTGGAGPGQPPGGPPRFGGGGRFTARRTKEGGIINTIIADERTNTLIVHANTRGADQVRELVAKLDSKQPTSTGGGKVHVVYLQFADAEQISNTLNNISQTTGARTSFPMPGGPGGGTGINPVAASLFEGAIKISPDKSTNALVITASPSDYVTVKRVIDKLDIPRDQVYIETIIMEVAVSRNFSFSASVLAANPFLGWTTSPDLFNLLTNPLNVGTGALIPLAAGGSTNVTVNGQTYPANNINGLIKAIQGNTNANVLATPQIIALDNAEANFESAEKIPVLTSTSVQGAGVSQGIQREPVAISIKIKPQINKVTSFVKLDVETKLGTISNRQLPSAVANLAYATQDRTAKTTVVVGDSDTIVLGGLTRDDLNETVQKVPILGDIPLLGWLFKSKTTSSVKNNLLIFMTPHIIRPYEKIRAILDKKLKERDDFIESSVGGDDTVRAQRDAIIRSLPDIKDFSKKPVTPANEAMDEERPAAVPVTPDNGVNRNPTTPQMVPEAETPSNQTVIPSNNPPPTIEPPSSPNTSTPTTPGAPNL